MPEGRFLVFEGSEGSGKTTQARMLSKWLGQRGIDVVLTREPGATALGQRIRSLLLERNGVPVSMRAEALLYNADRAQHLEEVVRPALSSGAFVISDRYADSTRAYQGAGRGLSAVGLASLEQFATEGLQPDLRILLDLDPAIGLTRRFAEPESVNRLDEADLGFHERVREAFLRYARNDPGSWLVLDANQPAEALHAAVQAEMLERFSALASGLAGTPQILE